MWISPLNRTALGLGGENDPAKAPSGKKARKRLDELAEACRKLIHGPFLVQLVETFRTHPGAAPTPETWYVETDRDDPDQQTLLFRYPSGAGTGQQGPRYLRP